MNCGTSAKIAFATFVAIWATIEILGLFEVVSFDSGLSIAMGCMGIFFVCACTLIRMAKVHLEKNNTEEK